VAAIAGLGATFSAAHRSRHRLTNIPSPAYGLSPTTAGLVLAGYAIALLVAASRTTMWRDLA